jgi:hypothetical protein
MHRVMRTHSQTHLCRACSRRVLEIDSTAPHHMTHTHFISQSVPIFCRVQDAEIQSRKLREQRKKKRKERKKM